MRKVLGLLGAIVFLSACTDDPISEVNEKLTLESRKVGILCEGNFLWENAQMDIWVPDSARFISKAFEKANNKPLGDVLQSAVLYGSKLYLVVNSSGIVYSVNPKTLEVLERYTGFTSPRYAVGYQGKLYVSDINANNVAVLDTLDGSISSIPVLKKPNGERSGWTENIIVWNDKIISAVYDGFLWVHNPIEKETDLIALDTGAQYLALDAKNRLWVGCSDGESSSLTAFDASFNTMARKEWKNEGSLGNLSTSVTRDTLWYTTSGELNGISINDIDNEFPVIVPYTSIYGMGVDPRTGEIYVSDAVDYVSQGRWLSLTPNGDSITHMGKTGIIPGGFSFF